MARSTAMQDHEPQLTRATVFFGESCSLSYLSAICTLVKRLTGTEMTLSVQRDEDSSDVQAGGKNAFRICPLPVKEAMIFLVDSFINNVSSELDFLKTRQELSSWHPRRKACSLCSIVKTSWRRSSRLTSTLSRQSRHGCAR